MRKGSIISLLILALLLVLVYFLTRPEETQEVSYRLTLGRISQDKAPEGQDARDDSSNEGPATVYEVDGISIEGPKGLVRLSRKDKTWRLSYPRDSGIPAFRPVMIMGLFEKGLQSSMGEKLSEADLVYYGLGDDEKIHLKLSKNKEVVLDIFVGSTEAGTEPDTTDTYIMLAGENVVYRIRNKNLREPLDIGVEQLADRRIFSFNPKDVTKILITDPREAKDYKLVFTKDPEIQNDGNWKLLEPQGYRVDGLTNYIATIANLVALRQVDKLPGADEGALDKTYSITLTLNTPDGETEIGVHIGAGRAHYVWLTTGDGQIASIPRTTATQLLLSLNEFRDKKLFTFKNTDITGLAMESDGSQTIVISREDGEWKANEPQDITLYKRGLDRLLASVANMNTQKYLKISELPEDWDSSSKIVEIRLAESAGGGVIKIQVGKRLPPPDDPYEPDPEAHWARLLGTPDALILSTWTVDGVFRSPESITDRRILRIESEQVKSLKYEYQDETLVLSRNGTRWDMTSPREKEGVSVSGVLSILSDFSVEELLEDSSAEEVFSEEFLTITVTLNDDKELRLRQGVHKDSRVGIWTSDEEWLKDRVFTLDSFRSMNVIKRANDYDPPEMDIL